MKAQARSRRARWAMFALRAGLVLVAARLLLAAIVPFAVERAARGFGFDVGWSRFQVHYLRGALEIDGLTVAVRPRGGAAPEPAWLRAEAVRVDVALRDLARGDVRVSRAEFGGIDLVAERRADRTIPVLAALEAALAGDEPAEPEPPRSISFLSPARLDALRIEQARVHVRDAAVHGPQTFRIDLDVRGDDLGHPDRRGRIEVWARAEQLFDVVHVAAEVETRDTDAVLALDVRAGGVQNVTIAPWLADLAGNPGLTGDARVARMGGSARIDARLRVDGSARDGIAGSVTLTGADVSSAGSGPTPDSCLARLSRAEVDVESLRWTGAHVGYVEVGDGAIAVRRDPSGALCALGFSLRADAASPASPAPTAQAPAAPFDVAVDAVEARRLVATWRDEVFEPAVVVQGRLDQVSLTGFDTRAASGAPIRLDVQGALDGIAAGFSARGAASVFAPRKNVELELQASGLRPTEIAPYLREIGLESTLQDGTLGAKLVGSGLATATGGVEGDLRLTDVKLADGQQLFGVRSIEALGLSVEPASATLRVRDLSVRGTDLPLERAVDGSFAGLGLHTVEPDASRRRRSAASAIPAPAASAAPSPAARPVAADPIPATVVPLPRVEIDRLAVVENRIRWRDDRLANPVEVVFDDCGIEVAGLALFGDPARHERSTARLKVWSRAKDVVKDVAVSGTISTKPGPLDLALEVAGRVSGITAARLQPYIDPTGIQEQLQEAALSGALTLHVAREADGLRADLELRDAEFQNADASVTGAKLVRVEDAIVSPTRLDVGSIEVVDGRLEVSRDPVGALLALGFRIPLSVFQRVPGPDDARPSQADESRAQRILDDLPDVRVGAVRVTNATLAYRDHAFTPPLATTARLDFALDRFSTRASDPARYEVKIGVQDSAEEIRSEGLVLAMPGAARITAEFGARGLRAGHLAAYLPAGVACDLQSAGFSGRAEVAVTKNGAGGLRALLHVADVELAEAGAARPLLALDEVQVVVRRADPVAKAFEIERVTSRGLAVDARRDAQGRIHALGFAVGAPAAPDGDLPLADGGEPPAPRSFPDLTPPGNPRVVLDELSLDVERLTFVDEARGTLPIELGAVVSTPGSQVLVDADPAASPPIRLSFRASAQPMARSLDLELSVAPWAEEPSVSATFEADGLSGAGLDAIARDLSTWIDGERLTEGVATGSFEARLRWRRRSPYDLDLRGGLAADVELGRLEFRDAPGGSVLLALDGGSAEIARIDPATGGVHVKTLELRKPEMRGGRTADGGFAVLGLVVHPERRPPPPEGAAAPADQAAGEIAARPRPPAPGEVRVDELIVRGIDVELRDDAGTPPSVLPLTDLDVLVQGFTTRAFEEPRTIRFDAWLGAGEAEMPRPARASNVLSGIASAVGDAVGGERQELQLEERPIFQEAVLSGRVQLVPELTGHAQATLSGLELLGFAGTARHEGVDVGDGTLDASVRLRFRGTEGVRVDTELVFSDLSLREPASGPIERYLTLPVPLDTALFLLENADGEHRIPIGFTLDEEGLTTSKITAAAAGAAASVLATAIASAPLRVLSTFTDLFGITGGAEEPPPGARVEFTAGGTAITPAGCAALAPLVAKLRNDSDLVIQVQHRLGAADVARAEMFANPSPEDCREIVDGLRRRRAELSRERLEVAADTRAAWGSGALDAAEDATPRLRALDAEAGNVEDGLDRVLELLKPGADRQRGKRTRAAALAVARQRVENLRALLAAQGIHDLDARFEAKSPAFEVGASAEPGAIVVVLRERQ